MPGTHINLQQEVHEYLQNPNHGFLMQFDIKNGYWVIPIHPDDRPYFAFYHPTKGQLQPTHMPQGTQSAAFSFQELILAALGRIPLLPKELQINRTNSLEPSLLEPFPRDYSAFFLFYFDDIISGLPSIKEAYFYSRYYFLLRII